MDAFRYRVFAEAFTTRTRHDIARVVAPIVYLYTEVTNITIISFELFHFGLNALRGVHTPWICGRVNSEGATTWTR